MVTAPAFHELTVSEVTPLTDDAVAITLAVPEPLAATYRYLPGQHVTVRADIDGPRGPVEVYSTHLHWKLFDSDVRQAQAAPKVAQVLAWGAGSPLAADSSARTAVVPTAITLRTTSSGITALARI